MSHFTKRALAIIAMMALAIPLVEAGQGQEKEPATFEIRLPPEIRSEQVQLAYRLTGPFGSVHGFVKAEPERSSYLIDTAVNHQAADSLLVIMYAPGCQTVMFTVHSLSESDKTREVSCEDLPTITFNGIVELPEELRRRPYEVVIRYMPFWQFELFHIAEGSVPMYHLARVTPDERGAFQVLLPNFTKDAVTESYHRNAFIRFAAVESDTGNLVCLLTPTNVQGGASRYDLPVQSKYPKEVIFKPRAKTPQNQFVGPEPKEAR
jgi:hypothetical protein